MDISALPSGGQRHRPMSRLEHGGFHVQRGDMGGLYDLPAFDIVGSVEAHHDGHVDAHPFYGGEHAPSDFVATGDAAEDVEEDHLDLGIGGYDLKGAHDLVGLGSPSHVEEVRRCPARVGHHVERAHHQPRTVAQHTDVAVQLHVGHTSLGCHLLLRVGGRDVAHGGDVLVTVEAVVVHRALRIEG